MNPGVVGYNDVIISDVSLDFLGYTKVIQCGYNIYIPTFSLLCVGKDARRGWKDDPISRKKSS